MSVESTERDAGQLLELENGNRARLEWSRARYIVILLSISVGVVMTGSGIVIPVFARRLSDFGSGVEALGFMTTVFALSQFAFAPFMGYFADRWGRRPIILLAIGAHAVANAAFLFAPSSEFFIVIRGFQGAITAGLFPAAIGMVADIVPVEKRSQWVGIVVASNFAGFALGPVIGGFLFDQWGFAAPFAVSAVVAGAAILLTLFMVPETRPARVRRRAERLGIPVSRGVRRQFFSMWTSLPRPAYVFLALLFIDYIAVFTFSYTEPVLVFYVYDDLGWSSKRFGFIVGAYGLSMMVGQVFLSRLTDKLGRKAVILVGLAVMSSFYYGLSVITTFDVIIVVAIFAGLGTSLFNPAMSALLLDICDERFRSRVMGMKRSAMSLGSVTGPLVVVVMVQLLSPQEVFVTSAAFISFALVVAVFALRESRRRKQAPTLHGESAGDG
ncbi:MAG: MFS transporter [Chloroflexi bacterium]|nr:MFS transporter [Chloroflexota bacterium]